MLKHFVTVRHEFIGFHKYEDAPAQVAFLKNLHRHKFKVEVTIEVFHDDRELEFFMVQDTLINKILAFITVGEIGSCEQIGAGILVGLQNAYGKDRIITIKVSEDGESDGVTEWIPDYIHNR